MVLPGVVPRGGRGHSNSTGGPAGIMFCDEFSCHLLRVSQVFVTRFYWWGAQRLAVQYLGTLQLGVSGVEDKDEGLEEGVRDREQPIDHIDLSSRSIDLSSRSIDHIDQSSRSKTELLDPRSPSLTQREEDGAQRLGNRRLEVEFAEKVTAGACFVPSPRVSKYVSCALFVMDRVRC